MSIRVDNEFEEHDLLDVTPALLDSVDIQGFYWNDAIVARKDYRADRDQSIKNYQELMNPRLEFCQGLQQETLKPTHCARDLYKFHFSTRREPCSIYHFQLRHLVKCTSAYDLCFIQNQRVKKWNRIFKSAEDWFDFSSPENGLSASQRAVKICSMTAASNVALVGGAAGEIAVLSLLERHLLHWVMLSDNALNIINHMCSFHDQKSILISSNDGISRALDLTSMKISSSHTLPWAINCSALHPDDRVYCAVGDDPQAILCDTRVDGYFASLTGHLDHSFAVAFSPNGVQVATGNQDLTSRASVPARTLISSRVYDLRNLSKSLVCLPTKLSPVRSLAFHPNGHLLAAAESDDYVSLYDVSSDFQKRQTIDFFGEVAGIDFAPGSNSLYMGIASLDSGGIIEFVPTESRDKMMEEARCMNI